MSQNSRKCSGALLKNIPKVEKCLSQGNYIPVLEWIAQEKNQDKKLEWLRAKEIEIHPPLLMELALEEYDKNPTLEVATQRALPLIFAGTFRVAQDCYSVDHPSGVKYAIEIHNIYWNVFIQLLTTKGHLEFPIWKAHFIEHREEISRVAEQKVREVAERSLQRRLSPPEWVFDAKVCSRFTTQTKRFSEKETKRREFVQQKTDVMLAQFLEAMAKVCL